MNTSVYWLIALLAVCGDLVKRFLAPLAALGVLYGAALMLLAMIWIASDRGRARTVQRGGAAAALGFTVLLMATYAAQFVTSVDAPLLDGFNHMLYMVVPLAYIAVVAGGGFRLDALAHAFLVLMIPVNAFGLVQYAVDPYFLVSTTYSGPLGGVVERNLLGEGGYFTRFPSILASADRYSAVALMQFLFAFVLLSRREAPSRRAQAWIAFNLASSFVALGIAGARSRILLAMLELVLVSLAYLRVVLASPVRSARGLGTAVGLGVAVFGALVAYFGLQDAPILVFLEQSFTEGDIAARVETAWQASLLSDEVSWFGAGLGTIGGGKPGEFGINAMWQESGLVWGTLLLVGFAGLVAVLTARSLDCALNGRPADLAVASLPLLVIVTALLTGLTSAFELSSGLLLACVTAFAVQRTEAGRADTGAPAMPPVGMRRTDRQVRA